MNHAVPFFKPSIEEADIQAVEKFLRRDLSSNTAVEDFEVEFANMFPDKACLACKSGTLAIYLVLMALSFSKGSEVIVSNVVCEGVIHAIIQAGYTPVLLDIESETANLNVNLLSSALSSQTKAIIAVHYGGVPCQIDKICEFTKQHKLILIEDCALSLGATYLNQLCGTYGDISVFSFYANKIITSGEGGAIIADYATITKLKSMLYSDNCLESGVPSYVSTVRYDVRMDPLSATLVYSQLKRLNQILDKRKKVFELYSINLKNSPYYRIPAISTVMTPSYYQFVIQFDVEVSLKLIIAKLQYNNIKVYADFYPNHKRNLFKGSFALKDRDFLISNKMMNRRVILPFFPSMSAAEVEQVSKIFNQLFNI